MYDELVTQCRDCVDCLCSDCKYEHLQKPGNFVPCMNALLGEAADAIEELSAKATPKRVGFTGWKGFRDTRYKCPYCNKYVRNDETYCHKCGQALMFPHISHTPYVPGEKQEVIVTWPDEPQREK